MAIRNWREWFVPPDEETPAHEQEDAVRAASGAGHRDEETPLQLKKRLPPRCAKCKKFMGFDTGMHVMLTGKWRIHIECFAKVVEKHLEEGESIDLTTGQIVKTEEPPS